MREVNGLWQSFPTNRALFLSLVPLCLVGSTPALAYRPFDGTDAAVADLGKMEIELQPAGALRDTAGTTLIAPQTRFNFGVLEGWEAVLEGQVQTKLSPPASPSLSAPGMFLKNVLRPGSLQDKTGPSIATEFGVLLPESQGQTSFGASLAGIVSQRWGWGAIHLNGAVALTREHHADLFLDTILEGPSKWPVRPVAEVFYEREFRQAQTISGLAGLIWQVKDDLALDFGVRHALKNGHTVNEVRAGLTLGLQLWPSASARR
jgi:hypothetical protein